MQTWTKNAPTTAGHVANLEGEEFRSQLQPPLILRLALGWTLVDQGLQRVLHDRLGQAFFRVVRAVSAAVGPRRDVDAARKDDHRVIERVEPHQPCERLDSLPELLVPLTGGAESAQGQVVRCRRQEPLHGGDRRPSRLLPHERQQLVLAFRRQGFEPGQGHFGLVVPWSIQPQHGLGSLYRRVVEQTFVDVPDLEDR